MGGHWPVGVARSETKKWKLADTNYPRFSDLLKAGEAAGHLTLAKVKDTLQVASSKYEAEVTYVGEPDRGAGGARGGRRGRSPPARRAASGWRRRGPRWRGVRAAL